MYTCLLFTVYIHVCVDTEAGFLPTIYQKIYVHPYAVL